MKNHPDTAVAPKEHSSYLRERIDSAQECFADIYDGANKKVISLAKCSDATIRENPYQALAIALGAGMLAGVLVARCRK